MIIKYRRKIYETGNQYHTQIELYQNGKFIMVVKKTKKGYRKL